MKSFFVALGLLTYALSASADDTPLPLILQLPDDAGVNTGGGLLMMWINSSVNKESAGRVKTFQEAIADFDFVKHAREQLACVGLKAPPCREVTVITGKGDAALHDALVNLPGQRALRMTLTPEMIRDQVAFRTLSSELAIDRKTVRHERMMSLIVTRRAPAEVTRVSKKNPEVAYGYWLGGKPTRIVDVAIEALAETAAMYDTVNRELDQEGRVPRSWSDLPTLKDLDEQGRAKCTGSCKAIRVHTDTGTKFWFVFSSAMTPQYGVAMGSFDAAAALYQTHLFSYVVIGLYHP